MLFLSDTFCIKGLILSYDSINKYVIYVLKLPKSITNVGVYIVLRVVRIEICVCSFCTQYAHRQQHMHITISVEEGGKVCVLF